MPLSNHTKIGISWAILTAAGVYLFYLSKSSVVQNRYENMKVRERMRLANVGDYKSDSK